MGGIFRSVRFGISEAHGGGNAIILNYLMEKGGVEFTAETARFHVNYAKMDAAVRDLSHDILMIEGLVIMTVKSLTPNTVKFLPNCKPRWTNYPTSQLIFARFTRLRKNWGCNFQYLIFLPKKAGCLTCLFYLFCTSKCLSCNLQSRIVLNILG
ncbi:MAG: hypothetical protein R3C26_09675 [Calditrichia bacterium]